MPTARHYAAPVKTHHADELLTDPQVVRALAMAEDAHRNQRRKYSGRPYFSHLERVARQTARIPDASTHMVAAAALHDLLEDVATPETFEVWKNQLIINQGLAVLEYVLGLTNPSKRFKKLTRAERKAMDRKHLQAQPNQVKRIKLIDRIDNLAETLFDSMNGYAQDYDFQSLYLSESLLLLDVLRGTDGDLENKFRVVAEQLGEWLNLVKLGAVKP